MKYKDLVKKASVSQTLLERKQEMEKIATVQKYMEYGLSFDAASALVKSSAIVTQGLGVAAKAGAKATKAAAGAGAQPGTKVGAKVKAVADDVTDFLKTRSQDAEDIASHLANTVKSTKEVFGSGKKEEDKKFTTGHMLGVGAGAAGLTGLAGLSIGMGHSRDKQRMPNYEQG